MIEVAGVAKYFGRFSALRRLDLTVAAGEFIALFGRNGAGKTTLLRIIAGLTRPTEGNVQISAAPGRPSPKTRGLMGFLSHNTALYGDLTAIENLSFYARVQGLSLSESDLESTIGRVGLEGREREVVRNYSRGMQQRLAIARAFLHDPEIYLLDEPFTGLDPMGVDFLKEYLHDARSRGKTCLMAIHDTAIGYELANRLVILGRGRVAVDITPSTVTLSEFQQRYRSVADGKGHAP